MAKFVFRLQRLLDVKLHREEECRRICSQRAREYEEARQAAEQLQAYRESEMSALAGLGEGELQPQLLLMRWEYLQRVGKQVADANAAVASARDALERAQGELLRAAQEREVLETLRDKRWREHVQHEEQVAQAELDEVAVMRYRSPAHGV